MPQWTYRPPPPNTIATAQSLDPIMIEQFQKFFINQPHAMSAFSHIGLSSSSSTGMAASIWVLDSGASHHMSPNLSSFVSLSHKSSVSIVTADGTLMPLAGVGSVVTPCICLPNVYHIPNLTLSLVFSLVNCVNLAI